MNLGAASTVSESLDLNEFLASVEKRVYRSAFFAVKHEDDALDIVQDSMMKFVNSYASNAAADWPLLFHRIVQNGIKDFFRRQKVRKRWLVFFEQMVAPHYNDDADQIDPLEVIADQRSHDLETQLSKHQDINKIEAALAALPLRQQQAFLLRSWEGLDTKDTATAMGCSEGSVKTHYFRALQQLKKAIGEDINTGLSS